jgi:hypothetical protein
LRRLLALLKPVERMEPVALLRLGDVVAEPQRRRSGPGGIREHVETVEADPVDEVDRRLEVRFRLTGISDDDVAGERQLGNVARSPSTIPRYSGAVYPRRIEARMRSEPDCTGKCR